MERATTTPYLSERMSVLNLRLKKGEVGQRKQVKRGKRIKDWGSFIHKFVIYLRINHFYEKWMTCECITKKKKNCLKMKVCKQLCGKGSFRPSILTKVHDHVDFPVGVNNGVNYGRIEMSVS